MTTVLSPAPTAPAQHRESAAERTAAPLRGVMLAGLSVVAAASNVLVWTAGCLGGIGFPAAVRAQRRIAAVARDRAHRWSGVPIAEPYRPVRSRGARRVRDLAGDPATWRDQFWGLADPFVGAFLALLPIALIAYGTFGAIVQPFLWRSIERAGGSNWYTAVHVHSSATAAFSIPIGVGLAAAGLWFGPAILRLHARWTRALLG
ncbi:MAG TPA: sensor domain-containing protein [Mycobacteriales bacterium]|nr:sensor domain-containing protein [Mycobacteriales bacterium]